MSSAAGLSKEKSVIFETVFSSPGMSQKCKINLAISRQNILLLGRLIEVGLLSDKGNVNDDIIASLKQISADEFKAIQQEILQKAELTEFYDRLKLL